MKFIVNDSKGNILTGTSFILLASMMLIAIFVISSISLIENENTQTIASDNLKYIVDDYSKNIEVLGHDSMGEVTEKVYWFQKIRDSRKEIAKVLNKKLDKQNEDFYEKYGAKITSKVESIENTDDPAKILFKIKLTVDKDNDHYSGVIERNASVEGLKDPLPYAKLWFMSGIGHDDTTIHYFQSLTGYLFLHHQDSPESYMFATAPMIIKKCPYDPYIHHGDGDTLKECLRNGYFHESADGSCYLCRIEGKGKCPHYGFEVFIQTHTPLDNETVSCSDHVVFNDHYNGKKIEYTFNSLILDNAHRKKYGLI